MTDRITSRRADVGLPNVANDYAYDDPALGYGTYFDDGFTWTDAAGSVLAGQQPLKTGRTFEEGKGTGSERSAIMRSRVGAIGGRHLGGAAVRHTFGE